jgi:hypothetical protein
MTTIQVETTKGNQSVQVNLKNDIPKLPDMSEFGDITKVTKCLAFSVLFLNLLVAGLGTSIAGCRIGGIYGKGLKYTALIQFMLFPCLVGWIWGLWTGIMLVKATHDPRILFINQFNHIGQDFEKRLQQPIKL